MKIRIFISILWIVLPALLVAQSVTITGKVTDSYKQALPGVSILIKNKSKRAVTNLDGYYKVLCLPSDTLIFAFNGYKTIIAALNGKTILDVSLSEIINKPEDIDCKLIFIEKRQMTQKNSGQ